MKKLILIIGLIILGITGYSQNEFRYVIRAFGGLEVGLLGEAVKIDSIIVVGENLQFYSGGVPLGLYLFYDQLQDKKPFVNLGTVIPTYLTDYTKTADLDYQITQRWHFIVGEAGAPIAAGDSIFKHADFTGKHIEVYKAGARLFPVYDNLVGSFWHEGDSITIFGTVAEGDKIIVDITNTNKWTDHFYEHALSFPIEGQGAGYGTVVFVATDSVEVRSSGGVTASAIRASDTNDAGIRHTVTISCPDESGGFLYLGEKSKLIALGNHAGASNPDVTFYTPSSDATSPTIFLNLDNTPLTVEKIRHSISATANTLIVIGSSFPDSSKYIYLRGNTTLAVQTLPVNLAYLSARDLDWPYSGSLHSKITSAYIRSIGANLTGALPADMTYFYLFGDAWDSDAALPAGLLTFYIDGTNAIYRGTALPAGLTSLGIAGGSTYTSSAALPVDLTYLYFNSTQMDWTGLVLGNAGTPKTYTTLSLQDFRQTDMSIANLLTLLENIHNNTLNLPSTVDVRNYDESVVTAQQIKDAAPVVDGTDAQKARYWIDLILGHTGAVDFRLNNVIMQITPP